MERLSGLDATFLYFETPAQHMHVSVAAVLDPSGMPGGYSFEKVQDLIASRLHLLPPFHRRLVRVPFDLHHPVWVEDPDFDVIHHVRRISCPAPGGPRELAAICGRINGTPLDRSRPLWEAWVIEGLAAGRFAFLTKVHHCAVDGASGAELLVHLFGVDRNPAPRLPPSTPATEHVPSDAELVRHALASRLRQPFAMAQLARRTVSVVADVVRRRRDPSTDAGGTPLTAPRTRFNGVITARRSAAFARVPLADVKAVRKATGVTVNDVVLAICAGTLRRYLAGHGANVPGPPFPLYLAGAVLVAAYPMGPVFEGAGLNITVLSYKGSVDFGFNAASNAVPDLWDMAECVEPAFEELASAVRASTPSTATRRSSPSTEGATPLERIRQPGGRRMRLAPPLVGFADDDGVSFAWGAAHPLQPDGLESSPASPSANDLPGQVAGLSVLHPSFRSKLVRAAMQGRLAAKRRRGTQCPTRPSLRRRRAKPDEGRS